MQHWQLRAGLKINLRIHLANECSNISLPCYKIQCGHCKKLKPDWDKLIADFEGSATQLVADVDCTAGGKDLCDANGVRGYPTLKWGDPSDLQDYQVRIPQSGSAAIIAYCWHFSDLKIFQSCIFSIGRTYLRRPQEVRRREPQAHVLC